MNSKVVWAGSSVTEAQAVEDETDITDLEEQALEVCELVRGKPQKTCVVVEHRAGDALVRRECVCE